MFEIKLFFVVHVPGTRVTFLSLSFPPMTTAVKVAVIGSGLAGLTTAYLLEKNTANNSNRIETHLFEKAKTLGMDAASITIKTKNGFRVDVRILYS